MIRRGDIYIARLGEGSGSESVRTRPAIVVSNDGLNRAVSKLGRGVVTIVPLTSNVERIHPFQVFLPARECGLDRDSKAQAEQIRSVAVQRLAKERIGSLPSEYLTRLDKALALHLGLSSV